MQQRIVVLLLLCAILCLCDRVIVPPVQLQSAPYAEWAHHHWVWLDAKRQNQSILLDMVQQYLHYNIPVGALNVDSMWSTGINNFIWDTYLNNEFVNLFSKKFPNATDMIATLHAKNIKVICWATGMINPDSPNFEYAKQHKYLLNDGKLVKWWHGHGALFDYTFPEGVEWWHTQLDQVLATGIDGFKIDGSDPLVWELILPRGHAGIISHRRYADLMYNDFFDRARARRGSEALIMSRPVDSYTVAGVSFYLDFSPHDVMFSGWVGDQDPSFAGMQHALSNMIHSAWHNYLNFGSDIGGYRTNGSEPLGRSRDTYIRWVQLGAFCALMENGGGGEHRPWKFDEYYKTGTETVDIYRTFATIHTELAPYLLSTGTARYAKNESTMTPMASKTIGTPSTFDYLLGSDIFVAPMTTNALARDITFPASGTWTYWFDASKTFQAGQTVQQFPVPLNQFAVFKRAGSIIPLRVSSSFANHGDEFSTAFKTLLISNPLPGKHVQQVHEFESTGYEVVYHFEPEMARMTITVSAHSKPTIVLLRGGIQVDDVHVSRIMPDGETMLPRTFAMQESTIKYDSFNANDTDLFIVLPSFAESGIYITVQGITAK